ncbi:hypothetical protein HDU79_005476 [Rhizoclosmatium sp. JEL0117]|nr:hypothetical protein HDU79_005476 [Rhizoclosmatium sp. JEL0117]
MQNTPTLLEVMKLLTQVATTQRQMQDQISLLQKQLTEVNAKTECTNKTLLRFETTQQSNQRRIQSIDTQLNWLKNQTATYHTRINSLPLEVLGQLLSWIHPQHLWKLRRVCKRFHSLITAKAFVIMNVKRFVASSDCNVTVSRKPTEIDQFYWGAPQLYQSAYVNYAYKFLGDIAWGVNEVGDYDNSKTMNLSRPLPPSLFQLDNLIEISVNGCSLIGSIPHEVGRLVNLKTLDLQMNRLQGEIPKSIGLLVNLRILNLSDNQLSGTIPDEIGNLRNLRLLFLNQNLLGGCLPPSLGRLSNLEDLNISRCNLEGLLPPTLGRLTKLEQLHLQGNYKLKSSIPPAWGELRSLLSLNISDCHLIGSVPVELGRLAQMIVCDLARNNLTGELPTSLLNLNCIERFDVRGNTGLAVLFLFPGLETD